MTKRKPNRKRCRPTRRDASAKALAAVDLAAIDPETVLRQIAADASAPATARVQACKALLERPTGARETPGAEDDELTRVALRLLKSTKR